jgi:hypothetical protein
MCVVLDLFSDHVADSGGRRSDSGEVGAVMCTDSLVKRRLGRGRSIACFVSPASLLLFPVTILTVSRPRRPHPGRTIARLL